MHILETLIRHFMVLILLKGTISMIIYTQSGGQSGGQQSGGRYYCNAVLVHHVKF